MVASVRDLTDIQLSTTIFSSKHLTHLSILNIKKDIIMHTIRWRIPVSLKNNFRDSSISTTLSKPYYECMEIQNHNILWFDQIKDKHISLSLNTNIGKSNIFNSLITDNNLKGKQHKLNETLVLNNILPSHRASIEDNQYIANTQYFEVSINYNINSPTEPNSWNGEAHPISIFGYRKFLGIDSKNIFTSLF